MDSIEDCIEKISRYNIESGSPLKKFIKHARFYQFKNIQNKETIQFDYPITAIVGENGIGKTSILHALYGMPYGYSTSKYWFSTSLDPIEGEIPRYIYAHFNESYKNFVETRKARVYSRRRKYEYWEPTKIVKSDLMEDLPSTAHDGMSNDRWNPVERNVVFINMKATTGGFERHTNFVQEDISMSKYYKEINTISSRIKKIAENNLQSYKLAGGRNRVKENRLLSDEELKLINFISGKNYNKARVIQHTLYDYTKNHATTIIFYDDLKYTEAFAGSGEVAIVEIILKILDAPKYSLILIDEPETSLHPGAQKRLLNFLLYTISKKYHQIVISTHSPIIIENLPSKAIKVLDKNEYNKTGIINNSNPSIAFNRLGIRQTDKTLILVEDDAAKLLIEKAFENIDKGDTNRFKIQIMPGGAESILCHALPTLIESKISFIAYLDGDKNKNMEFKSASEYSDEDLENFKNVCIEAIGTVPNLHLNGGTAINSNKKMQLVKQKEYLNAIKDRLYYLPIKCPELLFINDKIEEDCTSQEIKKSFIESLKISNMNSAEINGIIKYKLANDIKNDNKHILSISKQINKWVELLENEK